MSWYKAFHACANKGQGCTSQAHYVVRANFVLQCTEAIKEARQPRWCYACGQVEAARSTETGRLAGTYKRDRNAHEGTQ